MHLVSPVSELASSVPATSTHATAVRVEAVTFSYRRQRALAGLSFDMLAGEITALLGHNGAGKTTAIKLVNGLLRPDLGAIRVFGSDPADEQSSVRTKVAVVTDTLGLSERETPRQSFAYHAALYGFDVDQVVETGVRWMERFGLSSKHVDAPIKTFSRGMRQRVALCRALSGEPAVLLLDEPTLGMDPVVRQDFRAAMNEFRAQGGAVLMSTHDLGEVERLCQKVVVLQEGRVVTSGTTQEFMQPLFKDLDVEVELFEVTHAVLSALHAMDSIRGISHDYSRINFQARDRDAVPAAINAIAVNGGRIVRVGSASPTLEDAYLSLHGTRRS